MSSVSGPINSKNISSSGSSSSLEFPRGLETDIRPLFDGQFEIDPRRCNIDQGTALVFRQIFVDPVAEALQLGVVITLDPACRRHGNGLEAAGNPILVLQSVHDYIELQHTHRAQNQIVVLQRPKQLGRPLLAQLVQAFIRSGSLSIARRNSSGAKFGIPV